MIVAINENCIACGMCESMCSEVFKVGDKAEINYDSVPQHEDCIKEAANSCPVSAIIIE